VYIYFICANVYAYFGFIIIIISSILHLGIIWDTVSVTVFVICKTLHTITRFL